MTLRGGMRLDACSSAMASRPRLGAAPSTERAKVIGEGAGLVVVNVEAKPGNEGARFAQSLAPFGGEGGLAVSGGRPEDDQTARSRIVEGPHQSRSRYRKLANGRRHGLGQGNTR